MSKPTPYENRGNTRVVADLLGATHDSIVKAARKFFYDLETDSKLSLIHISEPTRPY